MRFTHRRNAEPMRAKRSARKNDLLRDLIVAICILVMIGSLLYMVQWEQRRRSIERDNADFSALYHPQPSETAEFSAASASPTAASPMPSAVTPSAAPASAAPAPTSVSMEPSRTAAKSSPSPSATPEPAPTPAPSSQIPIVVDATRVPRATANANTRVYALETPPPIQSSFNDLLATNADVVGFLRIGDAISLPVVQRTNDNEFYLDHDFMLQSSIAGTLFLDGANLLSPMDPNLIIYGHNMRNGTMFHSLIRFETGEFLKEHALVQFDTLYQNQRYVPFAVLSVTAEPDSARYVNIRQFSFFEDDFDAYIDQLRRLSAWKIPVDVAYGDSVLLLVTCEYTHNNGRLVVALRAVRPDEDETALQAAVSQAVRR